MRPNTVILGGGVLATAYTVAILWLYGGHLGSLPFSKTDPAPWGQFGDYVGGMLNPILSLLNLALVAYIATVVKELYDSKRKEEEESEQRLQTVVDLHREWNSESIYGSRTLSGKLVREYTGVSIFELEKAVPYERAAHIWIVIGFFQRLGFLVEHNKLHKPMTLELFAELFVWWWIMSFQNQLRPCECDARDRILKLKEWVYKNTTETQRAPWVHRAEMELDEAIQKSAETGRSRVDA